MNIEMNKVTWYSKLIAVIVFVAVFILGFYLGKEYRAVELEDTAAATSTETAALPSPAPKPSAPAPKPATTQPKGNYAALVTMTKSGFSPDSVTITVGQTVRFVNGTDGAMRIYSNKNLETPIYPGFDQTKSTGRGGTFDFLFNKAGVWGYHNLNGDPKVTGTVIVKAQ